LSGDTNINVLLRSLSPKLLAGEYVFCTVEHAQYGDFADASPIASFAETEGLTLVLPKDKAEESGLVYDGVFRCISFGVHSSLQAIGLTAAISTRLAEHGISANIMAAYFHDHVFVQSEMADAAIGLLSDFSKQENVL